MKLIKMHGAGNDFLFIDARTETQKTELQATLSGMSRSQWVKKVCERRFGVGADGLAFLEPHDQADFQWDFYNSDGSHAEMCGNAARCATLLFQKLRGTAREVYFLTASGPIFGTVEPTGDVTVNMGAIEELAPSASFSYQDQSRSFTLLDTGVPHAVISAGGEESLMNAEHKAFSAALRHSSAVGSKGANVTWIRSISSNEIEAVSFERGVEDFTLACGTGVVAAAFVHRNHTGEQNITVSVPGGKMQVDFTGDSPKLTGPAAFVAEIQLDDSF